MSARQFTLEYIISIRGGGTAGAQIGQVNNQLKATNVNATQAAGGFTKLEKATHGASTAATRSAGHLKGVAFGLIGLTSAGVEAAGMLGMYQEVSQRTAEAQEALNEATKTYGEDSSQATKASQELTKAQRFQSMVTRNLVLSMFDMVPFTLLLVNGIREQIIFTKMLRAEQIQAAATQKALAASGAALTASNTAQAASHARLATSVTGVSLAHFRLTPAVLANATAMGGFTLAVDRAGVSASRFATIMSSTWMRVLGPIAIAIGAIIVVSKAWQENWFGLGDLINRIGVALGNMVPQLKPVLDIFTKIGKSVNALVSGDFKTLSAIWSGSANDIEQWAQVTEEAQKRIDEFNESAKETLFNLAGMEKKELKGALFDMGIKGGAKSMFKGVLKDIDEMNQKTTGLADSLELLKQVKLFDEAGLKGLNFDKLGSKIFFTMEDRMDDLSEMFKKGTMGKKVFNALEEVMRAAAKDPGKAPEIIGGYLSNNPAIIGWLNTHGFGALGADLQAILDSNLAEALKKSPNTVVDIDPNTLGQDVQNALGITGKTGTSPIQSLQEKMMKELETWRTSAFNRAKMIGEAVWKGLNDIFAVGMAIASPIAIWINTNIVQPLSAFLGPVFTAATNLANQVWIGLNQIWDFAVAAASPVTNWINVNIIQPLTTFLQPVFNAASQLALKAWQGLTTIFAAVVDPVTKWVNDNIITPLQDPTLLDSVYQAASNIGLEVQRGINDILGPFSPGSENNFMNKFFGPLAEDIKQEAEGAGPIEPEFEIIPNLKFKKGTIAGSNSRFSGLDMGSDSFTDMLFPDALTVTPDILIAPNPNSTPTIDPGYKLQDVPVPEANLVPQKVGLLLPGMPPNAESPGDIGSGGGMWSNAGTDFKQLRISVPSVTVVPQQVAIDTGGDPTSLISQESLFKLGQIAQIISQGIALSFTNAFLIINTGFTLLTVTATAQLILIGITAVTVAQSMIATFQIVTSAVAAMFMLLATTWSTVCNSFIANAQAGASGIIGALSDMVSTGISLFNQLAAAAISAFNRMASAALSAINKIKSGLASIPRRIDVTVHVGVTGPGVKFMAKGFHGVVNTPTLMMVGEAGPERVDISKTGAPATGMTIDRSMNLTPSLPGGRMPTGPTGDTLVQVFLDGEQVKGKVTQMIVKGQAGFR